VATRRRGIGRFHLPNSRGGAIALAAVLTALGFTVGLGLLVVGPMARAGQGPFALLGRPAPPPLLDARQRLLVQAAATPEQERPELWQTPVASLVFPSQPDLDALRGSAGAARVLYDPSNPAQRRTVLNVPPIRDAVGRPVVLPIVALSVDDDVRTPGPVRPGEGEPTRLTVVATSPEEGTPAGCVLALREGALEVTAALGAATDEGCRAGLIRVEGMGALAFALSADLLPNYRSRDGSWREGGVFGRTEVWIALTG
jgi:hypothetical protein